MAVTEGVNASVLETAAELNLTELAPEALEISPPPRPAFDAETETAAIIEALDLAVAESRRVSLLRPPKTSPH